MPETNHSLNSSKYSLHRTPPPPSPGEELSATNSYGPVVTRALNNDNYRDAKKLVALFRSHYGNGHPFRKVYETDFWSRIQQRKLDSGSLLSLVALDGEEFIAHLAVDYDTSANALQILLPAIHPDYRCKLFYIVRAFWRHIQKAATRQGWRSIFTYSLSSQPMLELLATKCFHSRAVALFPSRVGSDEEESFPSQDNGEQLSILVMCRTFDKNHSETRSLYPPSAHARIIRELFDEMKLDRNFLNAAQGKNKGTEQTTQISRHAEHFDSRLIDSKGFAPQFLKGFGIYQLRITPAALADTDTALSSLQRLENPPGEKQRKLVVQVALDDSRCPQFCLRLESIGYRFCGILPMVGSHDFVAYTRFEDSWIRDVTLYSAHSKSLRDYILQGTNLV